MKGRAKEPSHLQGQGFQSRKSLGLESKLQNRKSLIIWQSEHSSSLRIGLH